MSNDTPDLFGAPEAPESAAPLTTTPAAAQTVTNETPATMAGVDVPPPPAPPADPEPEPEDDGTLAL
ncbi:MAG: hypothetical protein KA800_03725, partial [Thauera sp.]|nr:hypothetical protein [Thauera sp.]